MSSETNFSENEIAKSNYYKYFFEHSYDFTCIANTDGYFEMLNPIFSKELGYEENELLSKKFFDFIHPDDIKQTLLEVDKLKTGAITINFINRYRKKDGSYLWLEWSASPDISTGKLFAIARDITQRILNQNVIKTKTDELGKINNELEQLVYIITHNLQEPLEKIKDLTENFKNNNTTKFDNDDIEKLKLIIAISNNTKTFTNKLLFLTRLGKNKNYSSINCNSLIEIIKGKLEHQIVENKATISSSNLPTISGNTEEIEELFYDLMVYLIINHKKEIYPEIKISAELRENEFLFEFETNAKEIENNFENSTLLLLTSRNANEENFDNNLSFLVCKKIVNAHKGKIWIESNFDSNSKIYFTISNTL